MLQQDDLASQPRGKFRGSAGFARSVHEIDWQEISGARSLSQNREKTVKLAIEAAARAVRKEIERGDKAEEYVDTDFMNDSVRNDISAALSTMDKRIEQMHKDAADRNSDLRREMRLRERSSRRETIALNEALKAHIQSNDNAVRSALSALERTEAEFGKVKQANKEQRYWMAGIGVAIVLGIMGANATIFGGGKAFFDGGKDAVTNQQKIEVIIKQAQEQTEANRRILDEIRASQLNSAPKAG